MLSSIQYDQSIEYQLTQHNQKQIMDAKRLVSRSIVVDRVTEKIEKERYHKHLASLRNISRSFSKDYFLIPKEQQKKYRQKAESLKKSRSYVKSLFDARSVQNEVLVKKMVEIDGRKNKHSASQQMLPYIRSNKLKRDAEAIRKENGCIVDRILQERKVRSKQKILQQSKAYEKYKENLRKIKGKEIKNKKLYIHR